MTVGVYAIINTDDGRAYVGSSVNIEVRWITLRSTLGCGTGPSVDMVEAWRALGAERFKWSVLEVTDATDEALEQAEQRWMDQYGERLYNTRKAARRPRPTIVTIMTSTELIRRREALGLSRVALADEVGVDQATVWRWEQDKFKPSKFALRQLEQVLKRLERRAHPQPPGAAGGEGA